MGHELVDGVVLEHISGQSRMSADQVGGVHVSHERTCSVDIESLANVNETGGFKRRFRMRQALLRMQKMIAVKGFALTILTVRADCVRTRPFVHPLAVLLWRYTIHLLHKMRCLRGVFQVLCL